MNIEFTKVAAPPPVDIRHHTNPIDDFSVYFNLVKDVPSLYRTLLLHSAYTMDHLIYNIVPTIRFKYQQ